MRLAAKALLGGVLTALALTGAAAADDAASLPLDRWEVGRAPRDGAHGKLAAGAPRLAFAAGQEDVIARTVFDLPAPLASLSLTLELEGVRWDAAVSLDGKVLATGLAGDVALDLPELSPGKHELLVRARDLRAASSSARRAADDDPEGVWIAPVGRAPRQAGVLGPARLVERLPARVASAWVQESAGASELVVAVQGVTGEPCDVSFVASGAGSGAARVALAPGERAEVVLPWPAAPRWSPLAPARCPVSIAVAGKTVSVARLAARRIDAGGGRLAIDGAPVPFYLLDAPPGQGEAGARDAIARAREAGATALATGGERDAAWLDLVEASGLMIVSEPDLAPPLSAYALEDERFWRALSRAASETIARERGRPAIVAWSAARGLLREGAGGSERARTRLAALGEALRALDPTRPVVLSGDDGRSLGFALPWLAEPGPRAIAVLPPVEAPASFGARVALAGDPGFLDPLLVTPAHALERARRARAARAAGAFGIDLGAPAPREAALELRSALGEVALVPEDAPGGGETSGRRLERRFALACDGGVASIAVSWSLTLAGAAAPVASGTLDVKLGPDGLGSFALALPAPVVHERHEARLSVSARGRLAASVASVAFGVFPARAAPWRGSRRVVLVEGPEGITGDALLAAGVPWQDAPALAEALERESTLVIGEGALDEKVARPRLVALVDRARRLGVGVLVLRQTTPLPDGLAPPLEGLEQRGARELGVRDALDPVLAEVTAEDLLGWPGLEGALPPPALARPVRGDARVIVEGGPAGTTEAVAIAVAEDAPAPELLCQIPLAARTRDLPAARALLHGLVRAAGEPSSRVARPFFARVDADLEVLVEGLAFPARAWSLDDLARSPDAVILLDDGKAPLGDDERAVLERVVAAGATLVVRAPDDAAIARLGRLAPPGLKVEKTTALPFPAPSAFQGLLAGDLLWPPSPGASRDLGSRFDAAPRTARADGSLALVLPGALLERPFGRGRVLLDLVRWREGSQLPAARRYLSALLAHVGAERHEPPIRLPVNVWGGVGKKGDVIYFGGNSTANARFPVRRAGTYRVHLDLGGTKALGGWPVARVICDARLLGEVELDGPGPRRYDFEVTIPAGSHVLSVSFVNDVFEPPEDRDMTLKGGWLELAPRRVY